MSPAPYTTTYASRTPYLSNAEFINAPTGVDVNQLVPGGNPAAQTAALTAVIGRASSLADIFCNQPLACTQQTEVAECTIDRYGRWLIHPDQWPIVDVLAASVTPIGGGTPVTLNVAGAWLEEKRFILPTAATLGTSSVGPLQFGGGTYPAKSYIQYTYLAGWPTTFLTVAASAAATTFTVASVVGIYGTQTSQLVTAGTVLTFYDGANTEQVQVVSVAGNVVTISAGLAYTHAVGVSVSALPPGVKQAVISLTSALIKNRGSEALVMQSLTGQPTKTAGPGEPGMSSDVAFAKSILKSFQSTKK